MAVLTFPSITPEIQTFGIKYNTQISSSAISGIAQTVELPGARWHGSMSFRDMTVTESASLKAFLLELRGSSGVFFYGDITHTTPFNTVTGTYTLESTSTARIANITYDSASERLAPGDYVQIGADDTRELKMIIDSTLVGGLNYDLTLESMMRRIDYVGLSLVYTNPVGTFMLVADDQAVWASRNKGSLTDISLEFIEIF